MFGPVEKKVADNLTARWGFPDGHAEIVYRPILGRFTCSLTPAELLVARDCIAAAIAHGLRVGAIAADGSGGGGGSA